MIIELGKYRKSKHHSYTLHTAPLVSFWTLQSVHIVHSSGLRCLQYKIAKLWNELDTKLKEETSPTQFKSLLKLVLMIKLYSDYWFVTASYISYYGWCLCRPVLVFSPALCTFLLLVCYFWFSFAYLYLYPSEFTYNRQPALMIHGFSGCLCCIYILFRLLVFKLNMMMMMMIVSRWTSMTLSHDIWVKGHFVLNLLFGHTETYTTKRTNDCSNLTTKVIGNTHTPICFGCSLSKIRKSYYCPLFTAVKSILIGSRSKYVL